MGTGRSDYPNQINNVLCFPYLFRGALDVRATCINTEMMKAAMNALRNLAKEPVPAEVVKAAQVDHLEYGRDYLIPKPMDARFNKVIYISCGPESLVKDLTYLTKTHKITKIAFFDQFPYTNHLETGVLLERI